jgi:hypothetical protein
MTPAATQTDHIQLGKIVLFGDMINWCIMNRLAPDVIALDDRDMIATGRAKGHKHADRGHARDQSS